MTTSSPSPALIVSPASPPSMTLALLSPVISSTKSLPTTFSTLTMVLASEPTERLSSERSMVAPALRAERLRVSAPSPPSISSLPAPAMNVSEPSPPSIVSDPAPPMRTSSLAPPKSSSSWALPMTSEFWSAALASPEMFNEKTSELASTSPSPSKSISID